MTTLLSGDNFSGSLGFSNLSLQDLAWFSGSPDTAGTTSPVPKTAMSPWTARGTSALTSRPSRSPRMGARVIWDDASRASPALCFADEDQGLALSVREHVTLVRRTARSPPLARGIVTA